MCGCWSRYNIIYIFFLQRSPMFFINFIDYSRYIYYFSKPWGCFVCICMCVILILFSKFYKCFLSLEAVCVFVCMHVDVCGLGESWLATKDL